MTALSKISAKSLQSLLGTKPARLLTGLALVGISAVSAWAVLQRTAGPHQADITSVKSGISAAPSPAAMKDSKALPWTLSFSAPASTTGVPLTHGQGSQAAAGQAPDGAEGQLLAVYDALRRGERTHATDLAQRLTVKFPNFQLGQLIYADLLNSSLAQPIDPVDVGAEVEGRSKRTNDKNAVKRLEELLQESRLRLMAVQTRAPSDSIPRNFAALSPQHAYAIAVDTSKSRLYWFANRSPAGDANAPPKLELLLETYISVGMQGVGKQSEGDARTPLGIYFIGQTLQGKNLPDLYGPGALTLNYPNALDAMRGKTGSGIWLHGTPSANFSRAPLSTDGCVVMPNPEIDKLLKLASMRATPVVIARNLEWVSAEKIQGERQLFEQTLAQWQQARQAADISDLRKHYSSKFTRDAHNLDHWWPQITEEGKKQRAGRTSRVQNMLQWVDDEEHVIVTLEEKNQNRPTDNAQTRLYWAKEGSTWRIVYEGPLGKV